MIQKVYENLYGLIQYNCIDKDIETILTTNLYNETKATGSVLINIEDMANSLIWDDENKTWLAYDASTNGSVIRI